MTKAELLQRIKEDVLQREDDITIEMKLSEIEEWDSLANISIIALYDHLFGFVITVSELQKCQLVADLLNLVKDKLED